MSLVRLLAAGRSLVGLKEASSRYHLPNQRLLPKFEPKKNPFRSRNAGLAEVKVPTQEAVPQEIKVPAEAPAAPKRVVDPKPQAPPRPVPRAGFISKLGRMLRGGGGQKAAGLDKPRSAKSLVQAELSLDAVRVVRNDLSDTDLEIVTARPVSKSEKAAEGLSRAELVEASSQTPRSGKVTSPTSRGNETEKNGKSAVNSLVGRLFGAGKH